MRKRTYFLDFADEGWPDLKLLEPYFLTASGRKQLIRNGNDSWGIKVHGVDGTENEKPYYGRIDIDLTIQVNPQLGVLLCYLKTGDGRGASYYSKGDMSRLHEWVRSTHDDRLPVGLFIPWEKAWLAVKEFIERDAALPTSIEWVAAKDLPPNTFPAPERHPNALRS
jgi:hypothetical protein